MVNLWPGAPASLLCDRHLNAVLAEFNNLLLPSMRKGNSIEGYILHGCVIPSGIIPRIEECLAEAKKRGHSWKYGPISEQDRKVIEEHCARYRTTEPAGSPEEMARMNTAVLRFRCADCRKRVDGKHCAHESVCDVFSSGSKIAKSDGTPCMRNHEGCKTCEHDSRARGSIHETGETKFCINMGKLCGFWNGTECIHSVADGEPDCFEWMDEHDAAIRAAAKVEGRADTIWEMLKHFKFSCPGGPINPICDMCSANQYCIELRRQVKK